MTENPGPGDLDTSRAETVTRLRAHLERLNEEQWQLAARQQRLEGERRRIRDTLRALAGERPARHRVKPGATYTLLREFKSQHRSPEGFDAPEALPWMRAHGWRTTATNALGAISAALSVMANDGELEKLRRGRFRDADGPWNSDG